MTISNDMNDDQVAVIILNYFGFEATVKCIASVQIILKAHIFLVDNSADLGEKKRLSKHFRNHDHIFMIFPSENIGFAAGVNLGIRTALKEGFNRFLLLNNDAVLLEGAQEKLLKAYDEWPSALLAPIIKWNNELNKGYYYHKYLGFILLNSLSKQNGWLFFLSGCALAFNKSFLEQVGFLNEIFFMYGEDVEFCHRAYEKQIPIVLLEDELVDHAGSHSSKMASFFYEYHMLRAHYLLCFLLFKNPIKKVGAILGKTVILVLRSCFRCVKYRTIAPLAALLIAPLPLKIRPKRKPFTP
jgi:GT2 family glycosyltransferase